MFNVSGFFTGVKAIVLLVVTDENQLKHITKDISDFHQIAKISKNALKEDSAKLMRDFFASKR